MSLASSTPPSGRGILFAGVAALLHGATAAALIAVLVAYVPAAKRTFDEFGLSLPWLTVRALKLSAWVADSWWVVAPVLGLATAADFLVMLWLGRRPTRLPRTLWAVAVAAGLFVAAVVLGAALGIPLVKLREGLAR